MSSAVQRVAAFDLWRPGYAGKLVSVYEGATTQLAKLFYDQGLTQPAANPQTLLAQTIDGIGYGKFARPVYVQGAYSIAADGADQSGVVPAPITDLDGVDVGLATAVSASGSMPRRLRDRFDDVVHILDQGQIGTSAQTNADTITAAIGKVAAQGGGEVLLPAGTIPFTQLSLTTGVRLRGHGRGATTLTSVVGDKVVTIAGARCGLVSLSLDGIGLETGSVGVYTADNDELVMSDAEVKRFETGLWAQGMERAAFREFYVSGCKTNVKLSGDSRSGVGTGTIASNRWAGGLIGDATETGLLLEYVDAELDANRFEDLKIDGNATAVQVKGARFTQFAECAWTANTTNLDVLDGTDSDATKRFKVQGLRLSGTMNAGAVTIQDTAEDIVFAEMDLQGIAFTLTLPDFHVLLRDCIEDSAVTIDGDGTKLVRTVSTEHGAVDGKTIGSTPVVAWRRTLAHGEVVALSVMAVAQGQTSDDQAGFIVHGSAHRGAASLAYKTQTANFTVGSTVTGAVSKATGLIVADADGGATGTLSLVNVVGDFKVNEAITDAAGGAAIVSTALVGANAAVGNQSATSSYTSSAGCACVLAVSGSDVEVQVTGIAAKNFAWSVRVDCVSSN